MIVSDIKWVTDGEVVELPTEVEVNDDLSDDEIADYLSESYAGSVLKQRRILRRKVLHL